MTPSKTLQRACQLLRSRVRLENAHVSLPKTPFPGDDTEEIWQALRLHHETWVIPIIDAIQTGDTRLLKSLIDNNS